MTAGKYVLCIRQSEFSSRRLLREEFCSPWWVAFSHARVRDAQGRMMVCRKRGAYPADGMIKCASCGKWAPADHNDPLCVDCRSESDFGAFLLRVRQWPAEDRHVLFRAYWRRPMPMRHWLKEGMPPPVTVIDCDLSIPIESDDADSPNDADLHDGGLESDQTWGNAPNFHETLLRLRESFVEEYATKKGEKKLRLKRHGAGCHKVMLPESESGLRKEIAYYLAKGRVAPSARRLNDPSDRHERPLPMPGEEGRLWL